MNSRNLVLSYVEDYSAREISPFIRSLRESNYRGDVVLFTSNVKSDCDELFRKHDIQQIKVSRIDLKQKIAIPKWVSRLVGTSATHFIPDLTVNRRLSRVISRLDAGRSGFARHVARNLWHCQSGRFLYFLDFLREHSTYRSILISDARDVVFQDNPFIALTDNKIHVFEEYAGIPIGQQANNASWIRNLYGDETLKQLADNPIICCGVTIGGYSAMMEYLRLICDHIVTRYSGWGTDQGIHNYLFRTQRIRNARIHRYGSGLAMHIGIAPRDTISLDPDGRIRNREDRICPIIHQYDRHPDLKHMLTRSASERQTAFDGA
jgi:hypothetical protein